MTPPTGQLKLNKITKLPLKTKLCPMCQLFKILLPSLRATSSRFSHRKQAFAILISISIGFVKIKLFIVAMKEASWLVQVSTSCKMAARGLKRSNELKLAQKLCCCWCRVENYCNVFWWRHVTWLTCAAEGWLISSSLSVGLSYSCLSLSSLPWHTICYYTVKNLRK